MKHQKNGSFAKLVAFFIVATILTFAVTFAANGWQSIIKNQNDNNSGNAHLADKNDNNNSESNENKNDEEENKNPDDSTDIPVVNPIPEYINSITGLETTQELSIKKPISFILSSNAPLYGISSSFLTVEMPIEDGTTRLAVFTDDSFNIGKIGSIAPSRKFIQDFISKFHGLIAAFGNDDSFEYADHLKSENLLDFSSAPGYHYTEYSKFIYTNGDLVNAFINNSGINITAQQLPSIPYNFNAFYSDPILGTKTANHISFKFFDKNSTDLIYSEKNSKYIFSKNGIIKNDALNEKTSSFDNVFALFANSTTIETEEATETILDTKSGGKGVYITKGTAIDITWKIDDTGNLVFLNSDGEKLTVNRGTSYIGFAKSSNPESISIT